MLTPQDLQILDQGLDALLQLGVKNKEQASIVLQLGQKLKIMSINQPKNDIHQEKGEENPKGEKPDTKGKKDK